MTPEHAGALLRGDAVFIPGATAALFAICAVQARATSSDGITRPTWGTLARIAGTGWMLITAMALIAQRHALTLVFTAEPIGTASVALLYIAIGPLIFLLGGGISSDETAHADPSDWRAYLAATEPKPKLAFGERLKRSVFGLGQPRGRRILSIVLIVWAAAGIGGTILALVLHLLGLYPAR